MSNVSILVYEGVIEIYKESPPIVSLLFPLSKSVTTNVCTTPAIAKVNPSPLSTVFGAKAVVT